MQYAPLGELVAPVAVPRLEDAPDDAGEYVARVFARAAPLPYAGYAGLVTRPVLLRPWESMGESQEEAPVLSGNESLYHLVRHLPATERDLFVVVTVDANARVTGIHEEPVDGRTSNAHKLRLAVVLPVLLDAPAAAVVQCRASGDFAPKAHDVRFVRELRARYEQLGVGLLDHLIVAGCGWCSTPEPGAV